MTKKKRELIEILLDNITPDDWPVEAKWAAQDKETMTWGKNKLMFYNQDKPPFAGTGSTRFSGSMNWDNVIQLPELCKKWNKTIVHRDEFMKRWNERNPVVDSEGWIKWNGGEMPVEEGTLIDVKYRNGKVNLHVSAGFPFVDNGSISGKHAFGWYSSKSKYSIVAYRLHVPQEQKTPQQLALEKFGTGWHENEGVRPVSDEVLIDIRLSETGVYNKEYASTWAWNLSESNFIEEWRIHSDQVALLREPMPPCSEEIPCSFVDEKSPLSTQIGGDHYTKLAIQPMRYSMENGLDALQHTIIKYVTRFRDKAGIEDLEKAKHCIDMLIEYEKESK